MSKSLSIALVQITSKLDYKENLKNIRRQLDGLSGYQAVFLPECFLSLSDGKTPSPYLVEESGELFEEIKKLAIEHNAYFIGGSVAFKDGDKILNRSYNFNPKGELIGIYDKSHLFSCDVNGKKINEGDIYAPGKSNGVIVDVEGFKIGIGICFDLRFPEFLLNYYKEKVDVISMASAFTIPTGRAHWHTLLRARAIEGQCYVVASGQVGKNNGNISTYGHSLVVSPWGEVLCDLEETEASKVITLEKEEISFARNKVHLHY